MASSEQAILDAMEAVSFDDALEVIRSGAPKDYVLRHREIEEFFKRYFTPSYEKKYQIEKYTLSTPIYDESITWQKPRALI